MVGVHRVVFISKGLNDPLRMGIGEVEKVNEYDPTDH
jgi:hypothetical protein